MNKTLTENDIRSSIIAAGIRLLDTGLVARTWGNISARLSQREFIITPSGRNYRTTEPQDLVRMNILDLSYDCSGLKPSSEHGIHAAVYRLRPEASFVIHTHQFYATAVSGALKGAVIDITDESGRTVRTEIPCAKYGVPGTKDLWDKVERTLKDHPKASCILMARHGALCFGPSMEEAFETALAAEEGFKKLFFEKVPAAEGAAGLSGIISEDLTSLPPYLDDFAQMVPLDYDVDDREALRMVCEKNAAAYLYAKDALPIDPDDALSQHEGYVKGYSQRIK